MMKEYAGIDYGYRPVSYWVDETVLSALLRNVKGTFRRQRIGELFAAGRIEELSQEVLSEALSPEARQELSRIHPVLMGGEFLPDCKGSETEIARIEMESTTWDVISIRARRAGKRLIRYAIEDEYETEFVLGRLSSRGPLSLRELIELIDDSREADYEGSLALCYNEMNAGSLGRAALRHFTCVSSLLYPQLLDHYEKVYDDWVAGALAA